jgi:hypothetical protein
MPNILVSSSICIVWPSLLIVDDQSGLNIAPSRSAFFFGIIEPEIILQNQLLNGVFVVPAFEMLALLCL